MINKQCEKMLKITRFKLNNVIENNNYDQQQCLRFMIVNCRENVRLCDNIDAQQFFLHHFYDERNR